LSLLLMALLQFMALRDFSKGWEKIIPSVAESDPLEAAMFIAVPILVPVIAFCTGPALTLVTRNSLGGAAATFIYPFFLLIGGLLIVASMGDLPARLEEQFLLSYVLLVGGIYSGGVFLYGCRRFERLEDANLLAQELALPRQLSALFAGLTRHTAPGRHGPTANLTRKELRLQQPAFLVALFLVALWLTFIVVWQVHPPVGAEILVVPSILLALGIPVTVGIVSTAEERNLGVHEWHLTLPVSARRQWCVKVVVALVVNGLLGLVLPGLLAHASSWLANNPQLVAEIPGRSVSPLLIANLVIFCSALYASTCSANTMRGLIGTTAVLVTAFSVILWWPGPQVSKEVEGAWTTAWDLITGAIIEGDDTWLRWGRGAVVTCLISLQVLAVRLNLQQALCYPFANFRWRPDSSLVPVRQVVALTCVSVGLLLLSYAVVDSVNHQWRYIFAQ
jgi:hypothetical protein